MPAKTPSLTNPTASLQSELFEEEFLIKQAKDEEKGIYTAERLPPEKRKKVIQLLGLAIPVKRICELVNVHHCTVTAVRVAEAANVESGNQQLMNKCTVVTDIQLDRLIENPNSVPMAMAAVTAQKAIEIRELVAGRATIRVEHTERVDIFAEYKAKLEIAIKESEQDWADKATPQEKQAWAEVVEKMGLPEGEPEVDSETQLNTV